jgi:catalase
MANISAPISAPRPPRSLVAGLIARRRDPFTRQPNAQASRPTSRPTRHHEPGRWLAANNPPASWATTPYWGVNAFRFRGADGQVRYARWVFEPRAGVERLTEQQMRTPCDYLADELRRRVAAAPARRVRHGPPVAAPATT